MSRPIRTVLYCVLLLLLVVWSAARLAPPPARGDGGERDVSAEEMERALAALRAEAANGRRLVVVLGDSSLRWHPPLTRNETLTAMLEAAGERAGVTIRVVAHDGFDAVAYYLLVDEIVALRPEAVVLTANLQAFTDSWFRRVQMKHPQLAAFVRPTRVLEAMRLPLEIAGVDDGSLVVKPIFRAIGVSDLPEKIDGYRTRVRAQLDAMVTAGVTVGAMGVAQAAEPPAMVVPAPSPPPVVGTGRAARRRKAAPAAGAMPGGRGKVIAKVAFRFTDLYPANLKREQSTVRVLAAAVRDLAARDVRAIVMLAPLHLQALRLTGAYLQRNVPQALRVITEEVAAAGGTTIDLAEALPEETYFVDRYTHFTADGNRLVTERFLAALPPLLEPPGS